MAACRGGLCSQWRTLTKVVQYVCDEHELAGVELDHTGVRQQLGTLQVRKRVFGENRVKACPH